MSEVMIKLLIRKMDRGDRLEYSNNYPGNFQGAVNFPARNCVYMLRILVACPGVN